MVLALNENVEGNEVIPNIEKWSASWIWKQYSSDFNRTMFAFVWNIWIIPLPHVPCRVLWSHVELNILLRELYVPPLTSVHLQCWNDLRLKPLAYCGCHSPQLVAVTLNVIARHVRVSDITRLQRGSLRRLRVRLAAYFGRCAAPVTYAWLVSWWYQSMMYDC